MCIIVHLHLHPLRIIHCNLYRTGRRLWNVLAFITGADTIPAMGLEDPIKVYFELEAETKYCNVSTCVPSLSLPACMTSYEVMERSLMEAVKAGSVCFGCS